MLKASTTVHKIITAMIVVAIVLLETPAPYGHQGISPRYLSVALGAGLVTGVLGALVDRTVGYRQALFERFLVWGTITMVTVYFSGFFLPGLHISTIATAIAALATALLEILLPASAA